MATAAAAAAAAQIPAHLLKPQLRDRNRTDDNSPVSLPISRGTMRRSAIPIQSHPHTHTHTQSVGHHHHHHHQLACLIFLSLSPRISKSHFPPRHPLFFSFFFFFFFPKITFRNQTQPNQPSHGRRPAPTHTNLNISKPPGAEDGAVAIAAASALELSASSFAAAAAAALLESERRGGK